MNGMIVTPRPPRRALLTAASLGAAVLLGGLARQGFAVDRGPGPFLAADDPGWRLVDELQLTNFAAGPLYLAKVMLTDHNGMTLGTLSDAALAAAVLAIGGWAGDPVAVPPGRRLALFIDVPSPRPVSALAARLLWRDGDAEVVLPLPPRPVAGPGPRLLPPLADGPWAAVHAPKMARGHRRVFYATEGAATLPGRFAIDWFRLDAAGRHRAGRSETPVDWLGFDAPVLAVADAEVAAARDGVADHPSLATPRVPPGEAAGNFIALALPDGLFAFYEHLRPGHGLRPGDRVRAGQAIARLGFTGQTTGPHLHFHLADRADPLAGDGRPWQLADGQRLGCYADLSAVFAPGGWRAAAGSGAGRFPSPNSVWRF